MDVNAVDTWGGALNTLVPSIAESVIPEGETVRIRDVAYPYVPMGMSPLLSVVMGMRLETGTLVKFSDGSP